MPHAVHLSSVHHPFDPRIFHKQLHTLSENGYETTLIAHHNESTIRNGIHIDGVDDVNSRLERWSHLPTIARRAKKKEADIYHFHDPELLPVGWYLSKCTDGKVVYDVHENYTDAIRVRGWIPDKIKPIIVQTFPAVESRIANALDLIITADGLTRKRMQEQVDIPVTSVRNFPKTEHISIENIDVEQTSENVLVYVGGLDQERGLMTMLEVIAELRAEGNDVCLWLIGEFQSQSTEREAREFIDSMGLSDDVQLFGYVDHQKIFSYLALADIGLLLADEERFKLNIPTKFFEYLYCELPVISTPIPSLSSYSSDSYSMTVSSEDIETITSLITNLLNDTKSMEKMGESGRQKVTSMYCWEVEEKKLLDAYRTIASI